MVVAIIIMKLLGMLAGQSLSQTELQFDINQSINVDMTAMLSSSAFLSATGPVASS